jgi:molecular chaperone GrpE
MSGKRDESHKAKPAPDDEGGSIPIDPELEAALREATESVADPGAPAPKRPRVRSSEGILEAEPVSEAEAEAVASRMREELADTQDRLLRLQAEFENFRKRALRERQEAAQYGYQNLFKDLVSVVDNLERAIAHARESGGGDLASFLQGVELVQRELLAIFEKNHVTEIEALGKPFDPSLHEAMAQVESGAVPPNTVIDVLQKGFQLRDRLVRPSRVIVAKAADGSGRSGGGGDSAG